jgi:uncharacterized membrane protein
MKVSPFEHHNILLSFPLLGMDVHIPVFEQQKLIIVYYYQLNLFYMISWIISTTLLKGEAMSILYGCVSYIWVRVKAEKTLNSERVLGSNPELSIP